MNDSQQPVISARNLSASFADKVVWAGASFDIFPGELIAVLGPNGAGKSTLLRMLLGLQAPGAGNLEVLGGPPRRGNPAIGYVPQSRPWDAETSISGIDVVGFGVDGSRWGIGLRSRQKERIVAEAIAAVGAAAYAERSVGRLSGGERQRLLLAQALVGNPRLLLLDEPLASLDLRNQTEVAEQVSGLAKDRRLAVLLVTHDLNPLFAVVDRLLYIAGHGMAVGTPAEVITSETLSRLYETTVEVLEDTQGRRFIVGMEDVMAHPHGGHESGRHV
ncbi:MAG TPA: ABC transporter ATP-binding protein [Armatimonadota bacterium]|nr:ABC transporter ATP-binding protein [Armatimonadota bacterium]